MGGEGPVAPLVVTLALPDDVQAELDALRRRWFPAGRTAVGAHLTLFHAVPGEHEGRVRADLADAAGRGPLPLRVSGVMSLGRGAAYAVDSPELARRHRALQEAWAPWLTRQDSQALRAHVTVQNKVDASVARETVETLRATFRPSDVEAEGFDLWRYDGGPWTHLERFTVDQRS
ncbi:2'-5' RNA ligase family protein [Microlunatus flavus]|uniref:2'-5' RNA ligase superfamily protein n=1 Tax=Microlunatus flavus TaxID=1036181 RepID=A0A1H9L2G5_9ACTN|nr:2'-5' RNA ligase family protein [Microlunatus flavus]SER05508.1 2'-5' RNA ligase superfamily protein [Microlunatus flavus]